MNELDTNKLDLLEQKYSNLYKMMHMKDTPYKKENMYEGHCIMQHAWFVRALILSLNMEINSFLDYGCGKAEQYLNFNIHEFLFPKKKINPCLYDPGHKPYSLLPSGSFDMTLSFDVFEHIPEPLLQRNLNNIYDRTNKIVFLGICTKLAAATLPNGENAHCTVKPVNWWVKKIIPFVKQKKISTVLIFYGDKSQTGKILINENGEPKVIEGSQ